jgi:hypothetical protein
LDLVCTHDSLLTPTPPPHTWLECYLATQSLTDTQLVHITDIHT